MNQNPEQKARDLIDTKLRASGWVVQPNKKKNLSASKGVAVMEFQTSSGFADYVLFVNRKPVGIIEAKAEAEGVQLVNKVEDQSESYAKSKLKHLDNDPLPFVYESTGAVTRFTNYDDPKPRSRNVFSFHRPETFEKMLRIEKTLRGRLHNMSPLIEESLRPAQIVAIKNLEDSFIKNNPKSLIQMATGAGKTFTACTFVYRLLKHAKASRVLFLVDTKNLGEQAEAEFQAYQPKDDNRKFKELYNIQRLNSNFIASDSHVCISTIQRLYSILKEKELDEKAEEENNFEKEWRPKEPMPVVYNEKYPFEMFDFIIVDECHRSIYNLWSQVLEYFDSFLIGLTATPDKRTFGYFEENLISEYTFEESVIDKVNVDAEEYVIETEIGTKGGVVRAKQNIKFRGKLSRKERWAANEEDIAYEPTKLDRDIVNPSQIRNVIREFKRATEQEIFPDRRDKDGAYEMPKTLIFAKTDSHADDIIKIVRKEFGEGNEFCRKITDGARKDKEDPKLTLNKFRNSWNPRIAVTVDMIATGTDVKPLEIVLFMRNVKSANYFAQMKGRGCRSISLDDLKQVTRTAKWQKDHFVIVDAVGVLKNKKSTSRPLISNKSIPLKSYLDAVTNGAEGEELFTNLAGRLIRMDKQITEEEKEQIEKQSNGIPLNTLVKNLLNAYDPDIIEERAIAIKEKDNLPSMDMALEAAQSELVLKAAQPFTGELSSLLDNIRKVHEQLIDTINLDTVTRSEWVVVSKDKAEEDIQLFTEYIETYKDEIQALSFFYNQPFQQRGLTEKMVKELLKHLRTNKPKLAPHHIWAAYEKVEEVKGKRPEQELIALIALVRRVTKIDERLTDFRTVVNKNFQDWVFKQNAGQHQRFSEEQMTWLRMIKDHITKSFDMQEEDLEYTPFDAEGGRLKMKQLFGDEFNEIINELNQTLVA